MDNVSWTLRYIGIAYLMVSGMVLHAAIVGYMNILVHENRLNNVTADIIKIIHLFLFFLLSSYAMGAVFGYARKYGAHNDKHLYFFSLSGFTFILAALLIINKISKRIKSKAESE